MEFTKEITFSDGLKSKGTTTITYSGALYKCGSESVSIVYGFGNNWDYTSEKEMGKVEGGFSAEIEIKEGFDTFNFCFRNGNYEWDNNQSSNYISTIDQTVVEEVQDFLEEDTNFDTDFLIELLDSLFEDTFEKTETLDTNKQQILDDILSENITPSEEVERTVNVIEDFDMNELVENILNPVVNCVISEESKFDTISIPVVKAEKVPDFTVLADVETDVVEDSSKDTKTDSSENSALVPVSEDVFLVSPRKLRKFYFVIKKIKLAFYKLFVAIPKILNGNFNEDKN